MKFLPSETKASANNYTLASIENASAALAFNLMSWYQNNGSSTPETAIGTLPAPHYWWYVLHSTQSDAAISN